jgi:hypothetical protein
MAACGAFRLRAHLIYIDETAVWADGTTLHQGDKITGQEYDPQQPNAGKGG